MTLFQARLFRSLILDGSLKTPEDMIEFINFGHELFKSINRAKAFMYLCLHKDATSKEIEQFFKMPETTIHRVLLTLRDMGLIESVRIISPKRRGGPRTKMWRLKK